MSRVSLRAIIYNLFWLPIYPGYTFLAEFCLGICFCSLIGFLLEQFWILHVHEHVTSNSASQCWNTVCFCYIFQYPANQMSGIINKRNMTSGIVRRTPLGQTKCIVNCTEWTTWAFRPHKGSTSETCSQQVHSSLKRLSTLQKSWPQCGLRDFITWWFTYLSPLLATTFADVGEGRVTKSRDVESFGGGWFISYACK